MQKHKNSKKNPTNGFEITKISYFPFRFEQNSIKMLQKI